MSTSTSKTTEQQQTEIDPALKAMYVQNYADSGQVGKGITNFGPYQGQRVAGATDAFGTGQTLMSGAAGGVQATINPAAAGRTLNSANDWLNTAVRTPYDEVGAYGYDPKAFYMKGATVDPAQQSTELVNREGIRNQTNAVTDRKYIRDTNYADFPRDQVRDVFANNIAPGMGAYQNTYTDQVIDRSTADLDRARKIAMQQVGSQAVSQGAFGGGRHGVQEAETNRGFADAVARMMAEQRSQGFNTAAQLSGQDVVNKLTAGQANQGADMNQAALQQSGYLQAGQANQQADLAWAAQQLAGGQQAQQANQSMDYQTAMQNAAAKNQVGSSDADRRMQAWLASAGYGQQAGLANQQAALEAQKFNAAQHQTADTTNQQAGFQNISQLLQAIQQGQSLSQQQYNMPMDAASKMLGLDAASRGITNEQIQAQMQAWNDERYKQLQALQLQSGALGVQLPNLGMSSTGTASTQQTPSGLQSLGQLLQIGAMGVR